MPILVINDSKSGCVDANVVTRKGACGFATKCAVEFLEFLGYKRINLKTDQEEAILTLKDSVKRDWDGEIVKRGVPRRGITKQRACGKRKPAGARNG